MTPRRALRLVLAAMSSSALVACTVLTGSSDLRVQQTTRRADAEPDPDPDPDPDPIDPVDDAGDATAPAGPFCQSLSPAPTHCIDFELADLSEFAQDFSGGTSTLQKDDDGVNTVLVTTVPNDDGWAFLLKPLGELDAFDWSYDIDVSQLGGTFVEFNEIGIDYPNDAGFCAVQGSAMSGKLFVTQFCTGPGGSGKKSPIESQHEIGTVQQGAGFHRLSIRFDFTTRKINASMVRPDGSTATMTEVDLNAQITKGPADLLLGIGFSNNASPQTIRTDNVALTTR